MSARGERDYRAVFYAMDDGFCVVRMVYDAQGAPVDYVFVETTPAFAHHTGMHNAQGRSMRSLVPELEQFWFDFYAGVVETGEPARTQYYAAPMGRWYDALATPFGPREDAEVANEQCGAKVRTAGSADEALRAFAARPPHVLISDIGMPQRGGHALIRRVRQLELHQGGEVPAIALTAYARREDREQALRAGFTTHVAKPVAPAELLALIASLVNR